MTDPVGLEGTLPLPLGLVNPRGRLWMKFKAKPNRLPAEPEVPLPPAPFGEVDRRGDLGISTLPLDNGTEVEVGSETDEADEEGLSLDEVREECSGVDTGTGTGTGGGGIREVGVVGVGCTPIAL